MKVLAPLVLSLALLSAAQGVQVAAPTHTPTATVTSTSTATATSTATNSPTPTPSPTAVVIGGGGGGSSACGIGQLYIPFPFTGGFCLDWWAVFSGAWDGVWSGLTSALHNAIQQLSDAILAPLIQTPNPAANSTYSRIEGVLAGDATDAFAVILGVAALWCARPAFFGNIEAGVSLLWRAVFVVAGLHSLNLLVGVWIGAANALSTDIGHATITDVGHSGFALLLAPVLLLLAGLERAVSLNVLGIMYMVAPLALVCFVWPPAFGIGVAWLRAFLYLSLLGPGYSLASQSIAATVSGTTGLWGDVLLVGGLLLLDLVPAIVAGLFSTAAHGGLNLVRRLGVMGLTGGTGGGG